jgi:cytochrome c553
MVEIGSKRLCDACLPTVHPLWYALFFRGEVRVFKYLTALVGVVALAGVQTVHGAGDAAAGRDKAFTCTGCHSAPGLRNAYPGYNVPKLGGQHADYIVAALKGYQTRERSHPTMQAHAATMSEQDMADIAAYFSSLGAN